MQTNGFVARLESFRESSPARLARSHATAASRGSRRLWRKKKREKPPEKGFAEKNLTAMFDRGRSAPPATLVETIEAPTEGETKSRKFPNVESPVDSRRPILSPYEATAVLRILDATGRT